LLRVSPTGKDAGKWVHEQGKWIRSCERVRRAEHGYTSHLSFKEFCRAND